MTQPTEVPRFGNWESEDVPYTAYFDNARKVKSGVKTNPDVSEVNTEMVSDEKQSMKVPFSQQEGKLTAIKTSAVHSSQQHYSAVKSDKLESESPKDPGALRPRHERRLSHGEGDFKKSSDSFLRHDADSRKPANSPHHRLGVVSTDSPRRSARQSVGSDRSVEQSPMHPNHQARLGNKNSGVSSPSWERKSSAEGILGLDPSTPGRSRLRSVTRGDETINAFIHCFVGVRKITSLYDLELAICKDEGTEKFGELDMGPLLRHPLVLQYFGASSEVKDVFKLTSEEIISLLSKFIRKKKHYDITADDLLNYIAKKKSVDRTEFLCVRIRNLVMHISYIQQGWNSEQNAIKNYLGDGHTTSGKKSKKRPDSSHKEQLDENSGVASQRIGSNTSTQKKSCGKHIRFSSTGSEDISNTSNNDKDYRDENIPQNSCSYLPQNASSDRVSSCPYPSMAEEIRRLGLKSEAGPSLSLASSTLIQNKCSKQLKRKRESENSSVGTPPQQLPKKHNAEAHDLINNKKYNFSIEKKKQRCLNQINGVDLERDTNSIRMFISTWKEACQENNVTQVLDMMIEFYGLNKGKKVKEIFMQKPCAELVNVAVEAIKSELSDKMYGTSQTPNQHGVANPISGNNTVMDQLSLGIGNVEENVLTGRLGELVAFKYFSGKYGGTCVKWVNETHESGFPYDIAVGDEEMSREYIEVKATKTDRKDWFNITAREWQFAIEKGECFSIARVTLQCNDMAKVTIYKNPARLCQLGQLQLAMLIPRQQHSKEFSVVP